MAKKLIKDIRSTLGILVDDRTTLGITRSVGRPKNLIIELVSIPSEEFFGTQYFFQEEDQSLDLVGISSEETFGLFWYYKFTQIWKQEQEQGGGGGELPPRRKQKVNNVTLTTIVNLLSVPSEEKFGKIDTLQYIDVKSIAYRDLNGKYAITLNKLEIEEEETLIISLLLSA